MAFSVNASASRLPLAVTWTPLNFTILLRKHCAHSLHQLKLSPPPNTKQSASNNNNNNSNSNFLVAYIIICALGSFAALIGLAALVTCVKKRYRVKQLNAKYEALKINAMQQQQQQLGNGKQQEHQRATRSSSLHQSSSSAHSHHHHPYNNHHHHHHHSNGKAGRKTYAAAHSASRVGDSDNQLIGDSDADQQQQQQQQQQRGRNAPSYTKHKSTASTTTAAAAAGSRQLNVSAKSAAGKLTANAKSERGATAAAAPNLYESLHDASISAAQHQHQQQQQQHHYGPPAAAEYNEHDHDSNENDNEDAMSTLTSATTAKSTTRTKSSARSHKSAIAAASSASSRRPHGSTHTRMLNITTNTIQSIANNMSSVSLANTANNNRLNGANIDLCMRFERDQIQLGRVYMQGTFSCIYEAVLNKEQDATANNSSQDEEDNKSQGESSPKEKQQQQQQQQSVRVLVKMVNEANASVEQACTMIRESCFLRGLKHKNTSAIVGLCVNEANKRLSMTIFAYCEMGNLKNYLIAMRRAGSSATLPDAHADDPCDNGLTIVLPSTPHLTMDSSSASATDKVGHWSFFASYL